MPEHQQMSHTPGKTSEDHRKNVHFLADLESIRVNQFQIIQESKEKIGSLSTTLETLKFDRFDPGFVYIITHISAIELGTGTPAIKIGVTFETRDHILESATIGNAEDSVEYVGQVFLKEGDVLFASFKTAVAGDTIQVFLNGYRIRR